jgi:hypothetical protein
MNNGTADYAWIGNIIIKGTTWISSEFKSNGGTNTVTLDQQIYLNSGIASLRFRTFYAGSGKYKIVG